MTLENCKQRALEEKNKGNDCIRKKDFDGAIRNYSEGLNILRGGEEKSECAKDAAVLRCNRALAYLKTLKAHEALNDCTKAIDGDPGYVKAFFRRALAFSRLGRFDEAREDLERAIQLEPTNKEAIAELRRIIQSRQPDGSYAVVPVTKPPDAKSNQPLRKIAVRDGPLTASKIVINDRLLSEAAGPLQDTEDQVAMESKSVPCGEEATDEDNKDVDNVDLEGEFKAPQSSFEFLMEWRRLQGKRSALQAYFMSIPSERFSTLISDFLDGDMLSKILKTLEGTESSPSVVDKLIAISKLPRFEMAAMFLDKSDKKNVNQILQRNSLTADQRQLLHDAFDLDG